MITMKKKLIPQLLYGKKVMIFSIKFGKKIEMESKIANAIIYLVRYPHIV